MPGLQFLKGMEPNMQLQTIPTTHFQTPTYQGAPVPLVGGHQMGATIGGATTFTMGGAPTFVVGGPQIGSPHVSGTGMNVSVGGPPIVVEGSIGLPEQKTTITYGAPPVGGSISPPEQQISVGGLSGPPEQQTTVTYSAPPLGGPIGPPEQQLSARGLIRPPEPQITIAPGGAISLSGQQVKVGYNGSIPPEQQTTLTYEAARQYQQTAATFGAAPSGSIQQGAFTYSSATGSGKVPSGGPSLTYDTTRQYQQTTVMVGGAPSGSTQQGPFTYSSAAPPGGGLNITLAPASGTPPVSPGGAPPGGAPPDAAYGAAPGGGANVMAYGAPPGGINITLAPPSGMPPGSPGGAPPGGAPPGAAYGAQSSGQGNFQVGSYAYQPPVPTYSTPRPDSGYVAALATTTARTGVTYTSQIPVQGPPQPQSPEQGPRPYQPHLNLQAQGFLATMVAETENKGAMMDPMAAFDLIDRNKDGVITRSEFEASVNAALPAE